jgi:apolipoprotein N-acyltransferase
MTIAEWIGLGLLAGLPYLLIGVVWSSTHTAHLAELSGADVVVSFLGSIASWPVLLVSDVCMT